MKQLVRVDNVSHLAIQSVQGSLGQSVAFGEGKGCPILLGSARLVSLLLKHGAQQVVRFEGWRRFYRWTGRQIPAQKLKGLWQVSFRAQQDLRALHQHFG